MDRDLLRPCEVTIEVKGEKTVHKGWFHCWEHYSEVVGESPLRGGHAAGQLSCILGIVELEDGRVVRVYPSDIQFTDRTTKKYD